MRWQTMLREAALRAAAAEDETRWAEVAEVTRAERAAVRLEDRLGAADGVVRVQLSGGESVHGRPTGSGAGWFALLDGPREHLVPVTAVALVSGVGRVAVAPGARRLGLGHALRVVSRDRAPVLVRHAAGRLVGRVDQVGADHLAVVATDEGDRPHGEPVLVPFAALGAISSR